MSNKFTFCYTCLKAGHDDEVLESELVGLLAEPLSEAIVAQHQRHVKVVRAPHVLLVLEGDAVLREVSQQVK